MNSTSNRDANLGPLNAEIRRLRAAGKPLQALRKLIGVELNFGQPGLLSAVKKLWDEHLFAGECLLLEAGNEALHSKSNETPASKLLSVFKRFDGEVDTLSSRWKSVDTPDKRAQWFPQACARSRLIQALLDDLPPESLARELRGVVDAYAAAWPHAASAASKQLLPADPRPAWLTTPGLPDGFAELLQELCKSAGAEHPAWHFVGDSVAYLCRPTRRFDCAWSADTWILLAELPAPEPSNQKTSNPKQPPWRPAKGLVAKLRVERVDQGCGAAYPHPASAGYLRVDNEFAASIQDALLAVIRLDGIGKVAASDYRWSVELVGKGAADDRHRPLTGPSAELSFAVALRATVLKEDLDAHVACTARFERVKLALADVGNVLRKAAAQDLADRQVTEILVAHGQDVDAVGSIESSTTPNGWRLSLEPVEDLRTAYERIAKFPRLTRAAKDYLRARSQRLLEFLCHPYERPSICRKKDVVDREAKSEDDLYERLDDAELESFFAGQPSAKRIQLFADSGFGKSTLLVELEAAIAGTEGPLVPVRVGAGFSDVPPGADEPLHLPLLDDELFRGSRQQMVKNLIQRLDWFADAESAHRELKIKEQDLRDWLQRKLEYGEVVFLFDAADQTSQQPTGVASLLKACRNCAAVVSGRPETKTTKNQLWGAEKWHTLYSRGFDQDEWRRYFSADASGANRRRAESRANEIWENEDWQPLVRPPILAEQVKNLETEGKLHDSTSRYDLYTISLEELVAKGLDTLNSTPETRHREEDWEPADVMDSILAPLAWRMLQVELAHSVDGTFRGQVAGQAYGELKASRREELNPITFHVLWQIGVTIRMAILDQDGKTRSGDSQRGKKRLTDKEPGGLSWRHLSFFEYFVGRAIAARPQEFATLAERHACTPQWRWPFRFALSYLAADAGRSRDLATLAECLMQFGNPFVVYEAIEHDHIALDSELAGLCRWLVHQHWDTRDALRSDQPPRVTPRNLGILETAFQLEYRDSRYLYAAWELLEQASDKLRKKAGDIRRRFLDEFPRLKTKNTVAEELDKSFILLPPAEKRAPEDVDKLPFVQGTQGNTDSEYPHRVVVSPFELMNFPVTNAQFELLAPRHSRNAYNETGEQPVTDVTWFEAKIFAIWAGADLPTEAQWEYAARAGATSKYGRIADAKDENGYRDLDTEDELNLVANYGYRVGKTTPRGKFLPNWWGIYDMLGNVWEWCRDWYSEEYYRELSRSIAHDPAGPESGSFRVYRGGSWFFGAGDCRSADRCGFDPSYRYVHRGFRLARVREAEPVPAQGKVQRAGA